MTVPAVTLADRSQITLDAVRAVAWRGAAVRIAPEAVARMDRCAESFAALVAERVREDPGALIYGVTSAPGDSAKTALDADARSRRPTRLWTGMAYGDPLPERVTRGIVLARLANFLGGHAAVHSRLAVAVAGMLDGGPLPRVPVRSDGGSGEILALGTLFGELSAEIALDAKEHMALINGSPCAAALVADVALAARPRLTMAESAFALAADLVGAPPEHFAPELEPLWGDPHEAQALRTLRALRGEAGAGHQRHQAAVSVRILPRVLGAARRAHAQAETAATVSLGSVSDNPVYIPPTRERPLGAVFSTGGYHNAQAAPAIDALGFALADLCQLSQRLTDHLFQHPTVGALIARDEWTLKPIHMAITGWAERARATAQPTLLSLGGFGQNDVPALGFQAWEKTTAIARCLDATLAGLSVVASQTLAMRGEEPPAALAGLVARTREHVAPITRPRPLGGELTRLVDAITEDALR